MELDDSSDQDNADGRTMIGQQGTTPRPYATWNGQHFDGATDFMNLNHVEDFHYDDPQDSEWNGVTLLKHKVTHHHHDLRATSPLGAFSFYAEVRFDAIRAWNRIFDFEPI